MSPLNSCISALSIKTNCIYPDLHFTSDNSSTFTSLAEYSDILTNIPINHIPINHNINDSTPSENTRNISANLTILNPTDNIKNNYDSNNNNNYDSNNNNNYDNNYNYNNNDNNYIVDNSDNSYYCYYYHSYCCYYYHSYF